ncbi:hypothetical protein AKO1_005231 [Acrasis kona]|uniref:NmrA-like domain-containing protein n=1 Tax=Acrasis kona TaxID=1008807 RepID=A0AAW2YLQ4_9EUKA
MSNLNYIKNVAVVGASGNSGSYMTECLIKTGKHIVTAITRGGAEQTLPSGIHHVKSVDYNNPQTIVDALRGQDALVITLGTRAPHDTQSKLIEAAAEAGVQWILPNGWSPDSNPDGPSAGCVKDVFPFAAKTDVREFIKKIGKSSFIDVHTGFWYEWSMAIPASFGFDFENKSVTFFDDGNTKISSSTWPQVGRAVAALLSLPIHSQSGGCLNNYRNQLVYVNSFTISQQDMFDSVLRVTGTKREDWKITNEDSQERYTKAKEGVAKGNYIDFAKMMYTRVFYKDGCGNFEETRGTINDVLGLSNEDLDEATKRAIKRSEEKPFGH